MVKLPISYDSKAVFVPGTMDINQLIVELKQNTFLSRVQSCANAGNAYSN